MYSLLKKPSAWLPIAMSLTMFTILLMYLTGFAAPEPDGDEGTGAHLFQIWLALEAFMVPFFGIKWLPQMPKQALAILAIQIFAVLAVCAPVFLLEM